MGLRPGRTSSCTGEDLLSDEHLRTLQHRLRLTPDDEPLREDLYRALLRQGVVDEDTLLRAATGGDPTAHRLRPRGRLEPTNLQHLLAMARLPLRRVHLAGQWVQDEALRALSTLPLDHLSLRSPGDLSAAAVEQLGETPLRSLHLQRVPASQRVVQALQRLALRQLTLTNASTSTFAHWGPFETLRSLALIGAFELTTADVLRLSCPSLERLVIHDAHALTNDGFKAFADATLTEVEVVSCPSLATQGLRVLGRHPLRSLTIRACPNLGPKALSALTRTPLVRLAVDRLLYAEAPYLRKLPATLHHVELPYSDGLDDEALATLLDRPLRSLHLAGADELSPDALRALPPSLTTLDLTSCPWLTDAHLEALASSSLSSLSLAHCKEITDRGVRALTDLPLTALDLRGCAKLTAPGLRALHPLALETLDLGHLPCVGDTTLAWLASLPLRRLGLRDTDVTPNGLRALQGLKLERLDLRDCLQLTHAALEPLLALDAQSLDLDRCFNLPREDAFALTESQPRPTPSHDPPTRTS